jgi:ATP synthase F1 delta subunit
LDINSLKVLCTSIPGRYALALFNEAKRSKCLSEIIDNFNRLSIFFDNNPQIKKLMTSKCINNKNLDSGWLEIAQHLSFCPIFTSFLRQLGENKRFDMLNRAWYVYKVCLAKYKNKRNVAVVTAVELLPEQKKRVEALISSKLFTEKTIIAYSVDPKVLGGIKIASEEIVFDGTVYNQVKQAERFLKQIRVAG